MITCSACKRMTARCVSRGPTDREATECYVALENGRAVKGCSYAYIPDNEHKEFIDNYIKDFNIRNNSNTEK